ncbi:MAG: hypothetical protein ACRYG6_12360 [Janthinobacterium lividum]
MALTYRMAIVGISALVAACQDPNQVALKVGAPPAAALNLRAFETRSFDVESDQALLQALASTLQDLGFTITETASDMGVLAASKQRDATEFGQIAVAVVLALVAGVQTDTDRSQDIHVTVVASAGSTPQQRTVRVSFDRYITTRQNALRTVLVTDPKIYQEFFDKLAQSLALEKRA